MKNININVVNVNLTNILKLIELVNKMSMSVFSATQKLPILQLLKSCNQLKS
jgi:hypothetical protein